METMTKSVEKFFESFDTSSIYSFTVYHDGSVRVQGDYKPAFLNVLGMHGATFGVDGTGYIEADYNGKELPEGYYVFTDAVIERQQLAKAELIINMIQFAHDTFGDDVIQVNVHTNDFTIHVRQTGQNINKAMKLEGFSPVKPDGNSSLVRFENKVARINSKKADIRIVL